jgi:hypothetical protein
MRNEEDLSKTSSVFHPMGSKLEKRGNNIQL